MSIIKKHIQIINNNGEKALSIFLTSGFPDKNKFANLSLDIFDAGADILEIGMPFSDPIADGNVIQKSSQHSLNNGINISKTFDYVRRIREVSSKPIVLMGYANPILAYGKNKFINDAYHSGVSGLIIPDLPIDEQNIFLETNTNNLDIISLVAPTTPVSRIKFIDEYSTGFVYCVSINGITGKNSNKVLNNNYLSIIKSTITKSKIMVGFGISNSRDAKKVIPYCDGIIVGSAIIKSLSKEKPPYKKTLKLISELKNTLRN